MIRDTEHSEDSVSLRSRLREGTVYVTYSGILYDVTDFKDRHPGGKKLLEQYNGHDVTQLMKDSSVHQHSPAAYSILRKYRITNTSTDSLKKIGNLECDQFELSQFSTLQDDSLVDWGKPILSQVSGLRENYYQWVHEPVDVSLRLFESNFLEYFSKCPWYLVPILWVPIALLMLLNAYSIMSTPGQLTTWNVYITELTITNAHIFPLFLFGLVLWTFTEYFIHRFIFHMKPPIFVPFLLTLHFLLHGQHHKAPMDRSRLVFPIVPAMILGFIVFFVYQSVAPWPVSMAVLSGTTVGYIVYDLIHYYLHHGVPHNGYFRSLKRYHIRHHFDMQQLGFGISSKFWDHCFRTVIPD